MINSRRGGLLAFVFLGLTVSWVAVGEAVDAAVIKRIAVDNLRKSEVADVLAQLTDVYGPRLSGTPRYLETSHWIRSRLHGWGVESVQIESYGDGLRGWEVESFSASMTSPVFASLNAHPICCGRSLDGPTSGRIELVDFYDIESVEARNGDLRGAILLLPEVSPLGEPETGVWSSERLDRAAKRTTRVAADGLDGPGSTITYVERRLKDMAEGGRSTRSLAQSLQDAGAIALLRSSSAPFGLVNNRFDTSIVEFHGTSDPRPIPLFVIPREQHSRLLALKKLGADPQLTLSLTTRYYEDPALHVNVIAEIPGVDPRLGDEVVILGAHLDSVELATGAADNAVGVATSMEVLRIFRSLNLKPRRTLRVALWGGEESGLLGSSAYVARHFGDIFRGEFNESQKRVSAYFNHDNNGHDIRGIFLSGRSVLRPVFEAYLDPFREIGASTVTIEDAGGTDIVVFDAAGIPSFEWIHDPGRYFTHQLHTNLDMPALVDIDSVNRNARIIASVVYHTAMRDDLLARDR